MWRWSLVIKIHPWRSNKSIADKAYFGKFKNIFLKIFLSLIFCSNLPVEYFHQLNGCVFKQTRAQILEALVKTNDIGFFPAARPKQRQRMDGLVVIGPKEGGGDHPGSLSLSLLNFTRIIHLPSFTKTVVDQFCSDPPTLPPIWKVTCFLL